MKIFRNKPRPGTVASDDLVDVSAKDLDRAEQGIARGALRELDAMEAQRKSEEGQRKSGETTHSAEKARSVDRQSSEHSRGPSAGSVHLPTIRGGVARILNAAAEAVEEYLDIEEDEDRVPMIPESDRFEGMRSKVEGFISQNERTSSDPQHRISLDSRDSLSQRGASLQSRGMSIGSQARSIPGVEASSTEQFNEKVATLGSKSASPFSRVPANQDPNPQPPERRLLRSDQLAFDGRSNTSFEIMGRDKVRDSMLAQSQARQSLGLPPIHRLRTSRPPPSPPSQIPRLPSERPGRPYTFTTPQDPTHRYSFETAPSQGLGTIEEIRYGDAGQLVRRRVALPWQTTLAFGCVTTLGCLCAMTTLGIAIRNVIYLNGPKAGPQIPDVLKALDHILTLLGDPQLHLPNG